MIEEIFPSIWRIDSGAPGATVAILGGVHGDERTGIEVVKKLHDQCVSGGVQVKTGALFLVLGNLEAMKINKRMADDGVDLNRLFEKDIEAQGERSGTEARAQMIASILKDVDISIDLHADHKPTIPFLACQTSPKHEQIYRWFSADRIVEDPEYLIGGKPVTTDEFVDLHGGVGICYETGFGGDVSNTDDVYESVLAILDDQGLITRQTSKEPSSKDIYTIIERIDCPDEGFHFAPGVGKASFETIEKAAVLGFSGDREVHVHEPGFIIFPKPSELIQPGKPVCWIAKKK